MQKILFLGYGPIASSIISSLLASETEYAIEVITSKLTDSSPKGFKVSDPLIWIRDQQSIHVDVVINSWRDLGEDLNSSRFQILKRLPLNPNLTIINLSSVAVYGECEYPKTENSGLSPKNLYGIKKLELEDIISSLPFFKVINLRISNVFGHPIFRDFLNNAIDSYLTRKTFLIRNSDLIFRDFISIDDVQTIIQLLINENTFFAFEKRVDINIGSGESYSLGRVLDALQEVCASRIVSMEEIAPADTIMKSFINTTKMNNSFHIKHENSLSLMQKEFLKRISS